MPEVSWVAEIVFFTSYFVAWATNELAHLVWLDVSAWAALLLAIVLLLFHGYPYVRRHPQ